MNKKSFVTYRIISVILLAMIFIGYILSIFMIDASDKSIYDTLANISIVLTTFFAIYYMLRGCIKSARIPYKLFMYGFLVSLLLDMLAFISRESAQTLLALPMLVSIVLVTIISTGKDLGKALTITLSITLIVSQIVLIIVNALLFKDDSNMALSLILINCAKLVLSLATCIMVFGKFKDKELRHSKENTK